MGIIRKKKFPLKGRVVVKRSTEDPAAVRAWE
jgi:hypothetical protein